MADGTEGAKRLRARVRAHLDFIYGESEAKEIVEPIIDAMRYGPSLSEPEPYQNYWDESDCWLITYATSIQEPDEPGLRTLKRFCDNHLSDAINGVHVLPFYPYSSDDGFAIVDYVSVDDKAGDWEDVNELAKDYRLMADFVLNHGSSQSQWFQNFINRTDPGKDYYKETSPDEDVSRVIRPRSTPLRIKVETKDGDRWLWCTFGPDQIDYDFGNPKVLLEFVRIMRFYLEQGVRVFRMDAVAFLWKEPGTTSMHDQRTHEIIKLFRTLVDFYDPSTILITETNVPNRDNLTYFGNANEAHAIYNFSLPPLLINALVTGDCRHLKTWMMSLPPARYGTAYLNFIASHDGIGLRPTAGLLSLGERDRLIDTLSSFGGNVSMRTGPDHAPEPYEMNISLIDALAGTTEGPDEFQLARFECAHAIMLALLGIPAVYIHSVLGTPNDNERVAQTGQYRSINRRRWSLEDLEALLSDPRSLQAQAFDRITTLLKLRRKQKAFHPNAIQFTMQLGLEIFGVWRQSNDREQSIFSISNVTKEVRELALENVNLFSNERWTDLISGVEIQEGQKSLRLEPYQTVWLSNQ
ncbi:MAG: sugar phosphorylase [Woeseiaceae bacterium]|nr:sugar phosphorylase [Woeseiaceae bacterium]